MRNGSSRRRGAVAVALIGGLVLALTAPASSAQVQVQVQVLEFPGPYSREVDLGKAGFGTGDEIFEIHDLLDATDESVALGQAITKITVVRLHKKGQDFTFILDCTVQLPGGDIVFYGGARFSELFGPDGLVFPVIGGTGPYAAAGGTVTIVPADVAGQDGAKFTFDLT